MRLSELAGERTRANPLIEGLTADSRAVKNGYLFAALPGVNADGATFIPQAEENGAAAVLARPGARSRLPLIADAEPRRRLAEMAARFYPRQPDVIAGVTGTNGKTSVARFAAELWSMLGLKAGSLGTLGAVADGFERKLVHTTPEPVFLHRTLHDMAAAGATHLAMEVSSHGLAQYRADGVRFSSAAFTNITAALKTTSPPRGASSPSLSRRAGPWSSTWTARAPARCARSRKRGVYGSSRPAPPVRT